ncbi:hypothetical protein IQ272_09145 [Chroococcidiopsidales cyanobacterium LEGE 13417]|nr:hypothetical protein [Chroococcidiopsidales cyanobacterium LEGE 13417]
MNQNYKSNSLSNKETSPFKQFFEFQKFQKTRRAVLSGEPIYELSLEERQKQDYLDALYFNLQESFFAALPTVVIIKVLNWIFENSKSPVLGETQKFFEVFQGIRGGLTAFVAPIIFTFLASFLAKASLKKVDYTTEKINRTTKAYLYFDGACGLYFQSSLSLSSSLIVWLANHSIVGNSIGIWSMNFAMILLLIGLLGQLKITWWSIPRRLFRVNGYTSSNAPWFKYSRTLLFSVPILSFICYVILAALSFTLTLLLLAIQQ